MKDIKVISGTLKISRSFALVSFYFFKSLTEIQGRNQFGQVGEEPEELWFICVYMVYM